MGRARSVCTEQMLMILPWPLGIMWRAASRPTRKALVRSVVMTRTWRAESRWLREPGLSAWVAASRLNLLRDLPEHAAEPAAQSAVERFVTNVRAAIERLGSLSDRSPSVQTPEKR